MLVRMMRVSEAKGVFRMGSSGRGWAGSLGERMPADMRDALSRMLCGGCGPEWDEALGEIARCVPGFKGKYAALGRLAEDGPGEFVARAREEPDSWAAMEEGMLSRQGSLAVERARAEEWRDWLMAFFAAAFTGPGRALPDDHVTRLSALATIAAVSGRQGKGPETGLASGLLAIRGGFPSAAAGEFLSSAAAAGHDHLSASRAYAGAAGCAVIAGDFRQAEALIRTSQYLTKDVWGSDCGEDAPYRFFLDVLLACPSGREQFVGEFSITHSGRVVAPDFPSTAIAMRLVRWVAAAGALQGASALSDIVVGSLRGGELLSFPDALFAYRLSKLAKSEARSLGTMLADLLERECRNGFTGYPAEAAETALILCESAFPDPEGTLGKLLESAEESAVSCPWESAWTLAILAPAAAAGPAWTEGYRKAHSALAGEELPGSGEELAASALRALVPHLRKGEGFPLLLLEAWTVAAFVSTDPAGCLARARICAESVPDLVALAGKGAASAFPYLIGGRVPDPDAGSGCIDDCRWDLVGAYETRSIKSCSELIQRLADWADIKT